MSCYKMLYQAVDRIRPYFNVDKTKPYAVYIWSKPETDDDFGKNLFDILEESIYIYEPSFEIPAEVLQIIMDIQKELRNIRLGNTAVIFNDHDKLLDDTR